MIVLAGAVVGVTLGVLTARRHGGKVADMAQYGAGFGIAFTLLGLLVTIVIERQF